MTGQNSVLAQSTKQAPLSFTQCFAKNTKLFIPGNHGEDEDFQVRLVQGAQTISIALEVHGKPPAGIILVNATTVYDGKTEYKGFRGIVSNDTK